MCLALPRRGQVPHSAAAILGPPSLWASQLGSLSSTPGDTLFLSPSLLSKPAEQVCVLLLDLSATCDALGPSPPLQTLVSISFPDNLPGFSGSHCPLPELCAQQSVVSFFLSIYISPQVLALDTFQSHQGLPTYAPNANLQPSTLP